MQGFALIFIAVNRYLAHFATILIVEASIQMSVFDLFQLLNT